jgi:aspartyl-tRNA(Asn)/glutamyl-tRNA(Gln) amidotransferase subunit A
MNRWPAIRDLADQVNSGSQSALALVHQALQLIEQQTQYQAIIAPLSERALQRAREIDDSIARGDSSGPLAGVPFIAKDNFLTFGGETTAASNMLRGFHAPYQATAIEKLESAGAICVAKANLDAFAHGSSTENSDFFVTKNPHDKTRVPGGSSGGSAAAVMLGMAPFALGTDTGGSIRLPASFCGAVGYKPTYGLVSRSGVVAMASSFDVIGPITRTVADAALVLDVMAGRDPLDGTTIERDKTAYTEVDTAVTQKKYALVKEYMAEGVDSGVRACIEQAITKLQASGVQVEEVSLPSLPLALAAYYIICPAEVSSNLSRYDGQRYGYHDPAAKSLQDSYELSREGGFGAEAKRRIMLGTYVLSAGYYDAYYKKAALVRTKLINEFTATFEKYDVLLGPVAPTTAFKIGEKTDDPLQMYLIDVMTVAANLVGIPAISLPAGLSNSLPVGLQMMMAPGRDRALLSVAQAFERLAV